MSLWSKSGPQATPSSDPIEALKLQMSQLTSLHTDGALGDESYNEARSALERRIVDAVVNAPAPVEVVKASGTAPSKALVLGLAGAVVAIAAVGYFSLGTPQALTSSATAAGPR